MKITVKQLKRIIREELERSVISEGVLSGYRLEKGTDTRRALDDISKEIHSKLLGKLNTFLKEENVSSYMYFVTTNGSLKVGFEPARTYESNLRVKMEDLKAAFLSYKKENGTGNELFDAIIESGMKPSEIEGLVAGDYSKNLFERLEPDLNQMGFTRNKDGGFRASVQHIDKNQKQVFNIFVKFNRPNSAGWYIIQVYGVASFP